MQQWQRRILGILAIGGSALGITIGLQLLFSTGNPIAWLFTSIFIGLYTWGIWCGVRMLEAHDNSAHFNFVFWAVQIPLLQSPYFGYFFSSGLFSTLTFKPSTVKFDFLFWLGSKFEYSLMQAEKPLVLGINVFALAVAAFLYSQVRKAPSNNSVRSFPSTPGA